MPRRRTQHKLIPMNKRRTIFEKRKDGMIKKAEELSTLCGAEIGIVVHEQGGTNNMLLWPSSEGFDERLQKFLACSSLEQRKKMVSQKKFLEELLKSESEDLEKMKKVVEEKEGCRLAAMATTGMERGGKSIGEMNLSELKAVSCFTKRMLKDLHKRKEEIDASEDNSK